ncbi:MAG: hypothetical protein SFY95_05115 [Planctomycetota bacterium]|nr:hypothetical protein [Planctomycetota bacterium]
MGSTRIARSLIALAGVLGLASALGGCHSAPPTLTQAKLATDADVNARAKEYWVNEGLTFKPKPGQKPRVVIAEFSVEVVTVKLLGLLGSRPVVGADEFSITGGALTLLGVGKEQAELKVETMKALPDRLLPMFEKELEARGYEVLPRLQVQGAPSYLALQGLEPTEAYGLQAINVVGSDTGRPKEVVVYPATGLKTLREDLPREKMRALLAETGSDLALRVRIRVGVDEGRATVERDSIVRAVWADSAGTAFGQLKSLKSIRSDAEIAKKEFTPIKGDVWMVNDTLYQSELARMFRLYARMGARQMN